MNLNLWYKEETDLMVKRIITSIDNNNHVEFNFLLSYQ